MVKYICQICEEILNSPLELFAHKKTCDFKYRVGIAARFDPEKVKEINGLISEQSIGFIEWAFENKWEQYDGHDRWICPSETLDVYSTKELFSLFLKK